MGRALLVAAVALTIAVALAACGDADDPGAQQTATSGSGRVELAIVYDDGSGRKTTGTLTCRGAEQRAEGALDGGAPPARLCAQARGNKELLTTAPDKSRQCAQIYGGPETAHVTGTIDGEKVDRRFARSNGCEIADFKRVAGLLPP